MVKGSGQLNLFILPSSQPITRGIVTWRYSPRCSLMGVNLPLEDEDKLIITRLALEYGFMVKSSSLGDISNFISGCEGLVCQALRVVDVEPPGTLNSECFTVPIPPIEPTSTILGLTLALPLTRVMRWPVVYEVFSDRWFRLNDLLLYLKLRGVNLNIYTTHNVNNEDTSIFNRVFKGKGRLSIEVPISNNNGKHLIERIAGRIRELAGGDEVPLRALVDLGVPINDVNRLIMFGAAHLEVSNGVLVLRLNDEARR
jgi:hypothetical protein